MIDKLPGKCILHVSFLDFDMQNIDLPSTKFKFKLSLLYQQPSTWYMQGYYDNFYD